jgi:hypothetical protein
MTIIKTIIWSVTYSFFARHIARKMGYEGQTLRMITFLGLSMGAIRGLYGEELLLTIM